MEKLYNILKRKEQKEEWLLEHVKEIRRKQKMIGHCRGDKLPQSVMHQI